MVDYGMLKTKTIQIFSSKRGRLRGVVAFKRFQIQLSDLETFGILKNWWLGRGGCNRKLGAHHPRWELAALNSDEKQTKQRSQDNRP